MEEATNTIYSQVSTMTNLTADKTEEELRKELEALQRQQREVSLSLSLLSPSLLNFDANSFVPSADNRAY